MSNKQLICLLLAAWFSLSACQYTVQKNSAIAGGINNKVLDDQQDDASMYTELIVNVADLDQTKTNLSSWPMAFSAVKSGTTSQRVQVFSSQQAIYEDTVKQIAALASNITGADYVATTIANRIASLVDFSKRDLLIVALSDGGPPFGQYVIEPGAHKTVTVCIKRPSPEPLVRGMALRHIFKLYAIEKGLQVRQC